MSDHNDCQTCQGERWVCENHMDKPWNDDGCLCGAGAPCPACNPCDADNPPNMGPSFTPHLDADKGSIQ